jgi:hypothetical protein
VNVDPGRTMRGKATCWSRRENRMIVMSIVGQTGADKWGGPGA